LFNIFIYVRAKITLSNGNPLPANDTQVGPVNLFLHSLVSQVDISLNGTSVTAASNTYPYRAYLESMLIYGKDAEIALEWSFVSERRRWSIRKSSVGGR